MSVEPLLQHISQMPHHDRELLLQILEVSQRAVIMDCAEKEVYQSFMLALWKTVKLEEMGE